MQNDVRKLSAVVLNCCFVSEKVSKSEEQLTSGESEEKAQTLRLDV